MLFRSYISNATGCSSIWGGTASISPYTVNKDSGHGPAWCNSLFEDNAEHGLGLYIGQKTIRENLIKEIAEVAGSDKASAELKAAYEQFIATKNNTKANDEAAHHVAVKGPKGSLNSNYHPLMTVKVEGNEVLVTRPDRKSTRLNSSH